MSLIWNVGQNYLWCIARSLALYSHVCQRLRKLRFGMRIQERQQHRRLLHFSTLQLHFDIVMILARNHPSTTRHASPIQPHLAIECHSITIPQILWLMLRGQTDTAAFPLLFCRSGERVEARVNHDLSYLTQALIRR